MTKEDKSIRRDLLLRIEASFYETTKLQRKVLLELLLKCKKEIEKRNLTKEDFCKDESLREHTMDLKNMGIPIKNKSKLAKEINLIRWYFPLREKDFGAQVVFDETFCPYEDSTVEVSIFKGSMEKIYHVAVEPMEEEIAKYKSTKPQYATPENVTQGMIYCMNFLTQKQKEVLMTIWKFYKEKKANPLTIPFFEVMNFKDADMIIIYKYDTKETGFVTRYLISDYICKDGDVKLLLNDDAVYELFECSELTTLESEEETH